MPYPEEYCDTCPRREKGLPLPCRAMPPAPGQFGHARFCELANPAHPDYQERYRRMLADEPDPAPSPPPPPRLPSIARQAVNLAGAVAQHITTGAKAATNVQREERLAICQSNACGQYREDGRCGVCGCYTAVKTSWADQACPLDPPMWGGDS